MRLPTVFPAPAQVFAGQVPELSFPEVLTKFGEEARLDGTYFFCKQDSVLSIAKLLEQVRISACALSVVLHV